MSTENQHNLRAVPPADLTDAPLFLLDMGDMCLLIPGADLLSLAPVSQVVAGADAQACGSMHFEQENLPVFCLDKHLQLQPQWPGSHEAVALVQSHDYRFALTCVQISKYLEANPTIYSVPVNMRSRKQLFTEFLILDKRAAGLTNAQEILRLLRQRGACVGQAVQASDQEAVNG